MKHLLSLILLTVIGVSAFAQQSGYGGDGKASSGASVSSFIRLYETAPGASTTALAGAGAGNVDNGAHLVKVTCYTPGGQTTGGTASNSTTVADKTTNGQIAISAIPTCSPLATGRKVYMTAAGGSSYFLLSNGTIANNTATTLTANDADATLLASTAMPTSNTAIDTRFTVGQSAVTFAVPITSVVGIGTGATAIAAKLHVLGTTEQLRLAYDASNYFTFTVGSGGNAAMVTTGGLIGIGGSTASFPGLRQTGTQLEIITADNSAWAPLKSGNFTSTGTIAATTSITAPTTLIGNRSLSVGVGAVPSAIGAVPSNGQNVALLVGEELLTIAAAATTDTTMQIPANAVVFSVNVRVTTIIPTAATFTVTGTTSGTVFNTAAVAVAATTTDAGTKSCPYFNATAQTIRITPNLTPGAATGVVRVTVVYYVVTPPTS